MATSRTARIVAVAVAALTVLVATAAAPPGPSARWKDGPHGAGAGPVAPFVTPSGEPGQTEQSSDVTAAQRASDVKPLPPAEGMAELRRAADTPPTMLVDADGHLRSVAAPPGKALRPVPGAPATGDAPTAAATFVNRYGQVFGLRPGHQVTRSRVDALAAGDKAIRFQQEIGGVPVLGGDLIVTVDDTGRVLSASGETALATPATSSVSVSAQRAGTTAVDAAAQRLGLDAATLTVGETKLWLYEPRMIGAPGSDQLRATWVVSLMHFGGAHAATALIDATDGTAVLVYSEHKTAKDRRVCDLANAAGVDLNNPSTYVCSDTAGGPAVRRTEGGPAYSVADVNQAYDLLGVTYDFFKNNFGRDSIDNRGMQLRATVRACHVVCPFANAFWDGTQMVFGPGFAGADDVVAHELTHGVTDFTSQLLYVYQSGAINEALSDIIGELVDQGRGTDDDSAWRLGESLPIGAIRGMKDPPLFGDPDRYGSLLWAFDPSFDDNGGVHTNSGVANKAAFLIAAGETFNGRTITPIGGTPADARAKSAQLWYRVMHLLTSGANYRDLGAALGAACGQLLGYTGDGRFSAFTVANCVEVEETVAATEMDLVQETLSHGPAEALLCPAAGQPIVDVFADGFERGISKWQRTNTTYWEAIPSATFPVRYAAQGKAALNGWANSVAPSTTTAGMLEPITIPSGSPTYLWFAHSLIADTSGSAGVQMVVDTIGQPLLNSWPNLVVPTTGAGFNPSGRLTTSTKGYGATRFDLSGFAGQSIRIGFRASRPAALTNIVDWYVDDVHIYQCSENVGQVRDLYGFFLNPDRTEAQILWKAPLYEGAEADYYYDVTVRPAIASPPGGIPMGTTTVKLTGLDPDTTYTVSVRAVNTSDNRPGVGRVITLRSNPWIDCSRAVVDPTTGRVRSPCIRPG
jgi:Zn-dependent metalloprotease